MTLTNYYLLLIAISILWGAGILFVSKVYLRNINKICLYSLSGLLLLEFLVIPFFSLIGLAVSRYEVFLVSYNAYELASLILLCGLLSFTTGYLVVLSGFNTNSIGIMHVTNKRMSLSSSWSIKRARIAAWVMFFLALLSFIRYTSAWGGMNLYIESFFYFRSQTLGSADAILKWFAQVGIVGSGLLWINAILRRTSLLYLEAIVHTIVSLVLILLLGGRGDILLGVLYIITAGYLFQQKLENQAVGNPKRVVWKKRIKNNLKIFFLGAIIIVVLGYYKGLAVLLATQDWYGAKGFIIARTDELANYVLSEFYMKDMLLAFASSVNEYRVGEILLQGLVNILPSSILGTQSFATFGAQTQHFLGWGLAPTPPGMLASLYWEGGLFGVALGMFLFGWLVGYIDRRITLGRKVGVFLIATLVLWFFSFEILRHAEYARSSIKLLTKFIPLLLALVWIQRTKPITITARSRYAYI